MITNLPRALALLLGLLWLQATACAAAAPTPGQATPPPDPGADSKGGIPFPNYFRLKDRIQSPLVRAIMSGDTITAVEMIRGGSNVTATVTAGVTPLMIAASMGQTSVVQQLLIRKIPLDTVDDRKMSALMYAGMRGRGDVVRALVKAGARLDLRDEEGRTPLICAVLGETYEGVQAILEADNPLVDAQDERGSTALHIVARLGSLRTAELLMAKKADPTLKNKVGRTAFDYVRHTRAASLKARFERYQTEFKK